MESVKLSKEELSDIIFYSLKENNIDIKEITKSQINAILEEYFEFCYYFKKNYVIGELDTFKRAACLLVAINRKTLSRDKRVNASIALDVAYKMCEKPYWNVGEKFDIPKKLEEVDFKKAFENNMNIFTTSKNMLIESLIYNKEGIPLNYNLNLELLYQVALVLKHKSIDKKTVNLDFYESSNEALEEHENSSCKSNKPKCRVRKLIDKVVKRK